MWRRHLALIGINLLVFVVLAEAIALVLHYFDTGWLFYARRPTYPLIEEAAQGSLTADALHPYFGPIHRPGVRAETNNLGFGSPHRVPFVRTDDRQLLLGIFGGSVARLFCDQGAPRLVDQLQRSQRFQTRTIVPLCFAHEGYKQPQQLIVLAYMLSIGQSFDLVVNIDGFNEVALGTYNHQRGHDISMPSPIHLEPLVTLTDRSTLTVEKIQSLAAISRDKERLNRLAGVIGASRSAAVTFVLERLYERTRGQYESELARFEALSADPPKSSLIYVTPPVRSRDEASLYNDIAAGWVSASLLMNDMLAARSVPYFHVLQPNQYFTTRRFSDDEARVARNDATPFKPPVERGYPALERAAGELMEKLTFVDATAIFDDEPLPVYADDCCHYTDRGNEILADAIAARIVAPVNDR
jgi:hypothetical protein